MANQFTPEEISQILEAFFDAVGTRQYIGARYVPIFGRKDEDSIIWDNSKPYEPLTIVLYQGNSYTSRQYVPEGVEITNELFWAMTGNYNAQIEQYRQEIDQFRDDYEDFKDNVIQGNITYQRELEESLDDWKDETIDDFTDAIDNIPAIIPSSAFSAQNTVKNYIDKRVNDVFKGFMVVLGDSWSDESNDPATTWLARVRTFLQLDGYVTNAKPGVGFYHGGANIPSQVAGALTKVEAAGKTAADVSIVVAMGGVNDFRHGVSAANVGNGVRQTWLNIQNTFPNARIYIIVGNTGNWTTMDTLDSDDPNKPSSYSTFPYWIANVKNNLQNDGGRATVFCSDVALWLNSYGPNAWPSIWNTDNLHPVQIGANIIAHHITSLILGINDDTYYHINYTEQTPTNHSEITNIPIKFSYSLRGTHAHVTFQIDTASAQTVDVTDVRWRLNGQIPIACGGTDAFQHRVPVLAQNFAGNMKPIRGYFNYGNNELVLYPASADNSFSQVFGSFDFDMM